MGLSSSTITEGDEKRNVSESSIARHICLNGAVQLFVTIQLGEMHDKKFINTITERFPTLHFTQNWAVVVPVDPTSVNDSIASLTVIPFRVPLNLKT